MSLQLERYKTYLDSQTSDINKFRSCLNYQNSRFSYDHFISGTKILLLIVKSSSLPLAIFSISICLDPKNSQNKPVLERFVSTLLFF
jgi:hypothetical protein